MAQNVSDASERGSKPGKRVGLFIVYNLVVVILFISGLEFATRVVQRWRLGPNAYQPAALRDRFIAWRNNPAFSRIDIHHNAEGFRHDQEVSVEKPANTVRIFFLGGSAAYGTQGLYPEVENRYSRIYNNQLIDYYLEQKLNKTFPSKQWEVINAATNEYRLHQDLAGIESILLRYKPDYVILMDGHNDVSGLFQATGVYDAYASTPHLEEFNALANPHSVRSLFYFTSTWLRSNSYFYHYLTDHVEWASMRSERRRGAQRQRFENPVRFSDLTPAQQAQFTSESGQVVDNYVHVARQVHRILDLDGIKAVFLLQPELILSHKALTDSEKQLLDYHVTATGPFFIYAYEQLYPQISKRMTTAAKADGFYFLDLTTVYDARSDQTFSDYCHLTPEGNRIVADRIFHFMQDSFAQTAVTTSSGSFPLSR